MKCVRSASILVLLCAALAGCGGGGGPPAPPRTVAPPQAGGPGLGGLEHSIDAARGAVSQSQQDAQRASATSAGP